MILLDTHIWVWWMDDPNRMPNEYQEYIAFRSAGELAVSVISCWEVAKLVELNRLQLTVPVNDWIAYALSWSVTCIPLTPEMAITSTRLPGTFHKDPADQMIVATAMELGCPLVTMDQRIRQYPHVTLAP